MALPDGKEVISIIVDREVKEELQKIAKKEDRSLSSFSRKLLLKGFEVLFGKKHNP